MLLFEKFSTTFRRFEFGRKPLKIETRGKYYTTEA
jgi:hypothetical protein